MIVFSTCALLKIVKNNYSKEFVFIVYSITIVCVLFPYSYSTYTALSNLQPVTVYDVGGLNTCSVIAGEYLPLDTDISLLKENNFTPSENVRLNSYNKQYLTATVNVTNTSASESYIEVPMLYYKGYTARDNATHETLAVAASTNNVVRVYVPANYNGDITIAFESPWYWHIAESISLLFICILIAYYFYTLRQHFKTRFVNSPKS